MDGQARPLRWERLGRPSNGATGEWAGHDAPQGASRPSSQLCHVCEVSSLGVGDMGVGLARPSRLAHVSMQVAVCCNRHPWSECAAHGTVKLRPTRQTMRLSAAKEDRYSFLFEEMKQ